MSRAPDEHSEERNSRKARGETRKMRGAIIGFGTIAMGHVAAYLQMPDVSILSVVDPSEERRAKAALLLPDVQAFATMRDLASGPELDIIDICCPPSWHAEYIQAALSMGWHVLCEKPLVLSAEDYHKLAPMVSNGSGIVFPCHNYKFSPVLRFMKDVIESEAFGSVVAGHFRTLRQGHALGVREWQPHWRRDPKISGGGILRDHGTHSIYLATHLSGLAPLSVSCLIGRLVSDSFEETEDTALLTMNFPGNVTFKIDLSWAAGFRHSSYSVIGSRESIMVDNDNFLHVRQQHPLAWQSMTSEFDDPSHKSWFQNMFQDFKAVVDEPRRHLATLEEALMTTVVIECAYASAARGGETVPVCMPLMKLADQANADRPLTG